MAGRAALLMTAALLLGACDPGSEVGFAPVDPLPTPDVEALPAVWWPVEPDDVGPETQVLQVLVLEQACAGGEPADGRILEPVVEADEQEVVVTFIVEQLEGAVTCPTNPPTPARLDLGEPLGDRVLLDGSTHPPRPPAPED